MTGERKRVSAKGFAAMFRKDMRILKRHVVKATHRTADLGRLIAFTKAPVAFAELRDGIIDVKLPDGALIVSTAPYSAAVEEGSRPHMPPIEPIVAWVRLRGTQGLDAGAGATGHPGRIAGAIARHGNGTSTPVDAAVSVAWAIALAIKKRGTMPHWFMQRSLPEVTALLDGFVRSFLEEPLEGSVGSDGPAESSAAAAPRLRDSAGRFLKKQ